MAAEPYKFQPVLLEDSLIASGDVAARRAEADVLLAALGSEDSGEQEQARRLFFKLGHFEDARRTLRAAESADERADAARRLGIIGSRQSTPLLIAALFDTAPQVRRAAAEALARINDPAVAPAPLQALAAAENARLPLDKRVSMLVRWGLGFWSALAKRYTDWHPLVIVIHAVGVIAFAATAAMAVQFLVLPFWLGILLGAMIYSMAIFLDLDRVGA